MYGVEPFNLGASTTSSLPISYSFVSGPATLSSDTLTITGVGAVTIAANQGGNSNYNAATTQTQTFHITKAPLTVTADDKFTEYTSPVVIPSLTYTITGFVYEETEDVLSGTPSLETTATSTSEEGLYPITINLGSLAADNYTFFSCQGLLIFPTQHK